MVISIFLQMLSVELNLCWTWSNP